MATYKYVVMNVEGVHVPVLFPSHVTHRGMAQALTRVIQDEAHRPTMPVSAGFVEIDATRTMGESESLNLSPRKDDLEEINAQYRCAHSFQKF